MSRPPRARSGETRFLYPDSFLDRLAIMLSRPKELPNFIKNIVTVNSRDGDIFYIFYSPNI